jgi:hypothetical protein
VLPARGRRRGASPFAPAGPSAWVPGGGAAYRRIKDLRQVLSDSRSTFDSRFGSHLRQLKSGWRRPPVVHANVSEREGLQ